MRLVLLALFAFGSPVFSSAQAVSKIHTIRCYYSKDATDSRAINPYGNDVVSDKAFEVKTVKVDLNNDGRKEVVVWESSWAGTSGGSLWILTALHGRYKNLAGDDGGWSPVLLLSTTHKEWRDIAYYQSGGGVEEMFIILRFDGKRYSLRKSSTTPPQMHAC